MVLLGRAEIGQGDKRRNTQLGPPFTRHASRETSNDIVHTSVEAYQFEHAAGQQCNNNQFTHAGNALSHGREAAEYVVAAGKNANLSRGKEPSISTSITCTPASAVSKTTI